MQFKNLDLNQSNKKGRIIIKLANLQKNAKGINQNMTKLTIFSKKLTLKSKFNGLESLSCMHKNIQNKLDYLTKLKPF